MTIIDQARRSITERRLSRQRAHGQAPRPAVALAPYDPSKRLDQRTLTQWGFAVDLDGITAHEDVADVVARAASDAGIRPVLVDVLADRREPSNARTRAFGHLSMALAN